MAAKSLPTGTLAGNHRQIGQRQRRGTYLAAALQIPVREGTAARAVNKKA